MADSSTVNKNRPTDFDKYLLRIKGTDFDSGRQLFEKSETIISY